MMHGGDTDLVSANVEAVGGADGEVDQLAEQGALRGCLPEVADAGEQAQGKLIGLLKEPLAKSVFGRVFA